MHLQKHNLAALPPETLWTMRVEIENLNNDSAREMAEIGSRKKELEREMERLKHRQRKLGDIISDRQKNFEAIGAELRSRGLIKYQRFILQPKPKAA